MRIKNTRTDNVTIYLYTEYLYLQGRSLQIEKLNITEHLQKNYTKLQKIGNHKLEPKLLKCRHFTSKNITNSIIQFRT